MQDLTIQDYIGNCFLKHMLDASNLANYVQLFKKCLYLDVLFLQKL